MTGAVIRSFVSLLILLLLSVPTAGETVLNLKKDFGAVGDGRTDDTRAFLQAAVRVNGLHDHVTLIIPAGKYQVHPQVPANTNGNALPVDLPVMSFINCNNITIKGEGIVRIHYADSLYYGSFKPNATGKTVALGHITTNWAHIVGIGHGIRLLNCENITISNLEVDGNNGGFILGSEFGDTGYQIGNDGLNVENTTNLTVTNCYFHHFGRDGFLLLNATPQDYNTPPQNIALKNCRFEYNGRQGFSWVGGVGLTADSCSFSYTAQGKVSSAPRAGIDFEPNGGYIAKGGIFRNCTFYKNMGIGIITDAGGPYVRDFQFVNCKVTAGDAAAIWIKGPAFKFTGCTIDGGFLFGHAAEKVEDGTRFFKCNFTDAGTQTSRYNYLVESNGARYLLFDGCNFRVREKALVYLAPGSRNEGEKPVFNNCLFEINYPKPSFTAEKAGLYCTAARFSGNTRFVNNTPDKRYDWNIGNSSIENYKGQPANIIVGKGFSLRSYEQITIGGRGSAQLTVADGGGLMLYHNAALAVLPKATIVLQNGGGMWLAPGVKARIDGKITAQDGSGLCIHEAARLSPASYHNIYMGTISAGDNKRVKLGLNTCRQLKK